MTESGGVLLVDKPVGPTSHDIVDRIRKTTGIRKVGHGGTLDPFASGLLLLLVGSATRLSEYFLGMDKEYVATVRLGMETSTHDPEGEVVSENDGWKELGEAQLVAGLQGLLGPLMQTPPAYSAKKVRGETAHRRMRRGEAVQLEPVEVQVYDLRLLELEMPSFRLGVRCSSGTYVRALARDLGRSLGVGGHLSALRRVGIGPFVVESAAGFDSLADAGLIEAELIPPAEALSHFPSLEVGPEDATRILHGQFLSMAGSGIPQDTPVRILLNGNLLAVATREGEMLRPKKVFARV